MNALSFLQKGLQYHNNKVAKATEGVSQAEALFRPYSTANSLLWEAGHLAFFRNTCLKLLRPGEPLEKLENEATLFGFGSTIQIAEVYPPLENIVSTFLERGKQIEQLLEAVTPEHWQSESPINFPGGSTVGSQVEFLLLHEGLHVGEMTYISTLIRRLR
ncbi:DinB family protein [Telluribacter sp.]|jgi:hypothetical protein|uniref:DinB family protein n=1 Tax=Telluribacter sp. TaxID=1978767 RepID=UPI002E0EED37|nr:DinB family protein [Telluribacter sp.]